MADESSANGFYVEFSPDGRLLVMVKDGGLNLVDLASGKSLATVRLRRARTPYFVDGGKSLLACGDDRLSVWPLECEPGAGGAIHLGQPRHITLPKTGHVDSAVMSRDRRRVALPLTDRDVAVFNLDDPAHPVLLTNGDCPKAPALSPDGKWVVTGTFHGRGAVVWDAISGRKLLDLDTGNSNPVFSPGGQILVVAGDREYRIFESGSWKLLHRIPTGSVIDLPACAAFSRDGRLLALVKKRHLIQLLDTQTWTELASLAPPNPGPSAPPPAPAPANPGLWNQNQQNPYAAQFLKSLQPQQMSPMPWMNLASAIPQVGGR